MLQRRHTLFLFLFVLCVCAAAARSSGAFAAASQSNNPSTTDELRDAFPPHQGVRVFTAPYKTSDRASTVVLAVEVGPAVLGLPSLNASSARRLVVSWTATDSRGRRRTGTAYDAPLALDADARATARRGGVRIVSEFDLPPGRYQLRVAVRGVRSESATAMLDVPEFSEPLSMAGVALSSMSAAPTVALTSGAHPRVVLPAVPTPRRDFEVGENVALFTEVYESRTRLEQSPTRGTAADPGDGGDHTTHLVVELRSDDGNILQTIAAQPADRRRPGAHPFVARLSLDVPTGRYVIRLKARANIGEPDESIRDIQIRVRPIDSSNTLKRAPVQPRS